MIERAIGGFVAVPNWLKRHAQLNLALADQAMMSGVNFCMSLLLARHLGIHEFGRFVLGWMAVLVATSLQESLITAPMMSIGPTVPAAERRLYFSTVLCHQTVWAASAFSLLLAGLAGSDVLFPSWQIRDLSAPLAVAAAAHLLQEFVRRYLYARGRAPAAFAIDAVYYLGRLAALLCLFQLGPVNAAMALWTIAASAGVSLAIGVRHYEPLHFSRASFKSVTVRHWRFARWLGASAVMFWACSNFFIFSAGAMLGAWAVGAIKAAQDIMGVTNILYQGLYNVVIVGAAQRLQAGGTPVLKAYLRQVGLLGALAVAAIGLIASAAPSAWLRLFYGEQYAGYGHLVQWYALTYLIGFLHLPLRVGLYVTENTSAVFAGYVCVAAFSMLSAYPLIHFFGLNGAMGGPVAAELIMCAVLYSVLRRRLSPPSPFAAPAAGAHPLS